jgi:hypothetical protein
MPPQWPRLPSAGGIRGDSGMQHSFRIRWRSLTVPFHALEAHGTGFVCVVKVIARAHAVDRVEVEVQVLFR